MSDLKLRRWTGISGLAIVMLDLAMFALYTVLVGPGPDYGDTTRYVEYWSRIQDIVLTRVFLDILLCACLLIFATGFRQLVRQARPEYEWVGSLAFAAGVTLAAITLVAASFEGGQALDTVGGNANPTIIRAFGEGYLLLYGSIGCMLLALFSAAAGYATELTGLLPRWTAWVAYATAVLNLGAVPLGFSLAPAAILTWAVIASFAFPFWVAIASIYLIVRRQVVAPTRAKQVTAEQRVRSGATV
jgi:hypothetical protein